MIIRCSSRSHRNPSRTLIIKIALLAIPIIFQCDSLHAGEFWGGNFSKLKNRVTRSLATSHFDSAVLLVGNKGPAAGDAKLFMSHDGGVSWRFLNQAKPLTDQATDVQALAMVSPHIILAGTWKHGLFRSEDAGDQFSAVSAFPSKDVRGLTVLQSGRVVAATGDRGLLLSDDSGTTWRSTSLAEGYFWSVKNSAEEQLLAVSPSAGLYQSLDQGDTWRKVLAEEKLYEGAARNNVVAAVGEDGLLLSEDGGKNWDSVASLTGQRLSTVRFKLGEPDTLLLGGWVSGLWEHTISTGRTKKLTEDHPVLHLLETERGIVAGTWGQGVRIYPHTADTHYLVAAAKAADTAVINLLLTAGAQPNSHDENKNTALIYAARDGLLEIAKSLITAGADINWIDGEGVTALILASFKNHPELVELFLANGADKSVVDSFGQTAVDYALRRGSNDPITLMLK